MDKVKVLYMGGYWATNIGNAFYELGIRHLLNQMESKIELFLCSDVQEYAWAQYNASGVKAFNSCEHFQNMDYLIIGGPMLSKADLTALQSTIEYAKKKGTKVVFLSAGGNAYTDQERREVRDLLGQFKLYALISRDHETFEWYGDLFERSYDGICCAFYIPEYFKPYKLNMDPYVVFNFETYMEPSFVEDMSGFEFAEKKWKIKGEKKKLSSFKESFYDYPEQAFHNFDIVRTKNTCFKPNEKRYHGTNIYLSDVPMDYLNIFANSKAVFSDRVHSCVAALALGIPAMFLGKTPRSKLFNSVIDDNKRNIESELVQIDINTLNSKRDAQRKALMEILI